MIKISHGRRKLLYEILNEYYTQLTPKTSKGQYYKKSIPGKLLSLISSKPRSKYNIVWTYIYNNIEGFIKGMPSELLIYHQKIQSIIYKNNLKFKTIRGTLNTIFDYKYFRKTDLAIWLAEELDIKVCPYCNRQFISVTKNNGKRKILYDFDHYFGYAKYPYFSLSFNNLIPSCHNCNSRLKHSIKFSIKYYLHPYLDSFNDILKFSTNILNTSFFFQKNQNFTISLVRNNLKNPTQHDVNRAKKTAKVFNIDYLYNLHKDFIVELVQKHLIYSPEYITSLYNEYSQIFSDKSDVYKMILGNYVVDSDIDKRPLSKLIKDISEEFGLLK